MADSSESVPMAKLLLDNVERRKTLGFHFSSPDSTAGKNDRGGHIIEVIIA